LNQNLNRELWSATHNILISVEVDVNPVFSTKKVRLRKPVPCPKVQVAHWSAPLSDSSNLARGTDVAAQAILSFEGRLDFL
jgi:hypothetical protein